MNSTEKLKTICVNQAGGMPQGLQDILALVVSVLLPLIQNCLASAKNSPATVAEAMKDRPIQARAAVLSAMRQAGIGLAHPQFKIIYGTITEGGVQATAEDVETFVAENTF